MRLDEFDTPPTRKAPLPLGTDCMTGVWVAIHFAYTRLIYPELNSEYKPLKIGSLVNRSNELFRFRADTGS